MALSFGRPQSAASPVLRTSDRGIVALIGHEGVVPGPYLDSVRVWTFGIGHTAAAGDPNPGLMRRGMPADLDGALREVFRVFRRDLRRYEADVAAALRVPVEQHEFDALVSFHYNTGGIGRAQLVKDINAGRRGAAASGFGSWVRPSEIIPRRMAEQRLFRDGVYPEGEAQVWRVDPQGRVIWRAVRSLAPGEVLALLAAAK